MGLEPHLPLNLKIRNVVRSIKDLKKYNIIVILNKHSILKNFMKLIKKKLAYYRSIFKNLNFLVYFKCVFSAFFPTII